MNCLSLHLIWRSFVLFCFLCFLYLLGRGGEVSTAPLAPWPFAPMEDRWARAPFPHRALAFYSFRWCMADFTLRRRERCEHCGQALLCTDRNPFLPCNEAELGPRSARFVSDMIKRLLWKETKVTLLFVSWCVCSMLEALFPFLRMAHTEHTHKRG